MFRKILSYFTLPLLLLLSNSSGNSAPRTAQSAPEGLNPGPDIITGDGRTGMEDLEQFGSSGTQVGLGMSTTSCNAGNVPVDFFAMPNTNHPVIPQNLYRMSGGASNDDRFEQIGQSWVKHAFGADQTRRLRLWLHPGATSLILAWDAPILTPPIKMRTQDDLGSRAWVNPFTGVFQIDLPATTPATFTPAHRTGFWWNAAT